MFPKARIVIGADELAWSLAVPWGETPVPGLYMRELNVWPTAHKATEGDVIFAGDAAKNPRRVGVEHHQHDAMTLRVSKASIDAIWAMWRKRPGSDEIVSASAKPRSAPGFGDDMETTTLFKLTLLTGDQRASSHDTSKALIVVPENNTRDESRRIHASRGSPRSAGNSAGTSTS